MKTFTKLGATAIILFLTAYQVSAVTKNVSNTKHNLAHWSPAETFKTTNVSEVCVFCHTPHGGAEYPLWNRDVTKRGATDISASFIPYSTHYAKWGETIQLGQQTLLCMSCHDGVSSMAVLHNPPNSLGGAAIQFASGDKSRIGDVITPADIGNAYDQFGAIIGIGMTAEELYNAGYYMVFSTPEWAGLDPGKKTADHPISINYEYVWNAAKDQFVEKAFLSPNIKLFGDNKDQMECSSCHDPHVDYKADKRYAPFLSYHNTSSALCFQCHIK